MTTLLVTGASGMLGRALMQHLASLPNLRAIGLCHSRPTPSLRVADLTNLDSIPDLLDDIQPDAILHTAAIRKPDQFAAHPDSAYALNVHATQALAQWVAAHPSTHLTYVSSDYVFDGSSPPYAPSDPIHPINAYGQSKADGEIALRSLIPTQSAILRVPVLYGNVASLDESSVTSVILDILHRPAPVTLDHWAIRYPTHVDDLARILTQLSLRHLSGTYHWSALTPYTKYQMGLEICSQLGLPTSRITPSSAPANGSEPRPKDCHLDRATLTSLDISTPDTPFPTAIASILKHFHL